MSNKYTTNPDTIEAYADVLQIELVMPSIQLVSLTLQGNEPGINKLAFAPGRRYFTLAHDWWIVLDGVEGNEELNGRVTVPAEVKGKKVIFDGASVPAPWLVSLLTLGVLRPMGVMLVASILHDFCYKHGYLMVDSGEGKRAIAVTREEADNLFRDELVTSTGLKSVGGVAWFFVKVGWIFGVRFAGNRFNCKTPIASIIVFAALLTFLVIVLQSAFFAPLMLLTFITYLSFYIGSLVFLSEQNPNNEKKPEQAQKPAQPKAQAPQARKKTAEPIQEEPAEEEFYEEEYDESPVYEEQHEHQVEAVEYEGEAIISEHQQVSEAEGAEAPVEHEVEPAKEKPKRISLKRE